MAYGTMNLCIFWKVCEGCFYDVSQVTAIKYGRRHMVNMISPCHIYFNVLRGHGSVPSLAYSHSLQIHNHAHKMRSLCGHGALGELQVRTVSPGKKYEPAQALAARDPPMLRSKKWRPRSSRRSTRSMGHNWCVHSSRPSAPPPFLCEFLLMCLGLGENQERSPLLSPHWSI